MRFSRLRTILEQLQLDLRIGRAVVRERSALIRLGEEVALVGPMDVGDVAGQLAEVRQGATGIERLRGAVSASLDADRADYSTSSAWIRPVVVLRGLCTRAVLHHQISLAHKALLVPKEAIGAAVANRSLTFARHPEQVKAVADARAALRILREERTRRLAPYGGSALPLWFSKVRRESGVLAHSLWLQLRPNVLPRSSALVGLGVGWWLADTYTDSHFKSVMSSIGLGGGGKRVVSGETYQAMMFWLPILAAGLFAYLTDRAHYLIHRRYTRPTPRP